MRLIVNDLTRLGPVLAHAHSPRCRHHTSRVDLTRVLCVWLCRCSSVAKSDRTCSWSAFGRSTALWASCALSQNWPIYKSTSTMATTETVTLSYLSPYKPGSPSSTTKDLESLPTYNQDHTWYNIHVTCYIKFTSCSIYIGVQKKILQH
jgi:hypothetical protein